MDRFGSFSREEDRDATSGYDDGIEAPPEIGTDERRMHVRAYNHWVSLLKGRAYPAIEDLEPAELPDFGPHSVLLDFSTGVDSPAITYLGDLLRRECDLPETISSVSEVPSRSLLSRLTDHYLQIIANRAPIGFEAEFVNQRGNNTLYRGILMPFSSDDDSIDFIYGVINWKEVAAPGLSEDLAGAVGRALQAAPHRPSIANAWADGPSADLLPPESDFDDADAEEVAEAAPAAPVARAPLAAVPPVPAFGPADDADDVLDLAAFQPDGSEELGDWLAAARDCAAIARESEGRSRAALYRALGLAYDFALVADSRPDDYLQLLEDSGIKPQARAPMTGLVKLVFGIDYDKTRLAEFAAALNYAHGQNLGVGEFTAYLEKFPGGLKGMVSADRAARRPERVVAVERPERELARKMEPVGFVNVPGDEEFVVLVARRIDPENVAVIGSATHDEGLVDRVLRRLNP